MNTQVCVDRWLLASCLQKAIRRGRSDLAVDIFQSLIRVDDNYARYRAAIIAVEDIGIANPTAVLHTLHAVNRKAPTNHLQTCIEQLASGPKDRTACVLGSLAAWPSSAPVAWETLQPRDAAAIMFDTAYPLPIRCAAAFRAAGTNSFPHSLFPSIQGDIEQFKSISRNHGVCSTSLEIFDQARQTHKEWHALFLPMIDMSLQNTQSTMYTDPYALDQLPLIDGLPSEGFDSHTRAGKEALRMLWNHHPDLREALFRLRAQPLTEHDALNAIESMVFLLEGQRVDSMLQYRLAQEVQHLQKKRWTARFGMDGQRAASVLWKYRARIHELRVYTYQRLR